MYNCSRCVRGNVDLFCLAIIMKAVKEIENLISIHRQIVRYSKIITHYPLK